MTHDAAWLRDGVDCALYPSCLSIITGVIGITLGHPLVLSDAVAVATAVVDAEETGVVASCLTFALAALLALEAGFSDLT